MLNPDPMTTKLLDVFEARKSVRLGQMEQVGCQHVCSLDWTKQAGEKLHAPWLVTLVDVDYGTMIWQKEVQSTKVEEIADDMTLIADRPNFKASVCMIDNVPLSANPQQTTMILLIKKTLLKKAVAPWVGQDYFHVMHNVSPEFNNQDPRYHSLVIVLLRNCTKRLDVTAEAGLDMLLKEGKVAKKTTFCHSVIRTTVGTPISEETIKGWKVP